MPFYPCYSIFWVFERTCWHCFSLWIKERWSIINGLKYCWSGVSFLKPFLSELTFKKSIAMLFIEVYLKLGSSIWNNCNYFKGPSSYTKRSWRTLKGGSHVKFLPLIIDFWVKNCDMLEYQIVDINMRRKKNKIDWVSNFM